LMGDQTAIPPEWEKEDGSLTLVGESANEFIECLRSQGIPHSDKFLTTMLGKSVCVQNHNKR